MTTGYDAIVVGARCAGSPTAMLLARKGYRVLLVDRATFPSDTISTHAIHAPGVAALRRWGLLDAVRATGCPPLETYRFDFGFFTIAGTRRRSTASPPATRRAGTCSTRSCWMPRPLPAQRCASTSPSRTCSSRTGLSPASGAMSPQAARWSSGRGW
jgi:choline dehydrogenase-like flavoprotein